MSLRLNKDNIYIFVPQSENEISINKFMENDFTIFLSVKIYPEELPIEQDCYMFARNGKHSGINIRKLQDKSIMVSFSYWFKSNEYKYISYVLPEDRKNEYNEYLMRCDNKNKSIHCYINNDYKGTILYDGLEKEDYSNILIWLGCGNMMGDEQYKSIGDFETDLIFLMDKSINNDDVYRIKSDYIHCIDLIDDELPVLNNNIIHKDNILFLSDFKHKTPYKIWNYTFNGITPQFYIENNIYF